MNNYTHLKITIPIKNDRLLGDAFPRTLSFNLTREDIEQFNLQNYGNIDRIFGIYNSTLKSITKSSITLTLFNKNIELGCSTLNDEQMLHIVNESGGIINHLIQITLNGSND